MGTHFPSEQSAKDARKWVVVDAKDQVVGRLASRIASILRGKTKPDFVPYHDGGDFVVVINASQLRLTGQKLEKKFYHRYTGFVGNMKSHSAGELLQTNPERIIEEAVKGMLPKTALGRRQLKKLRVFAGAEHTHEAQVRGSKAAEVTTEASV